MTIEILFLTRPLFNSTPIVGLLPDHGLVHNLLDLFLATHYAYMAHLI